MDDKASEDVIAIAPSCGIAQPMMSEERGIAGVSFVTSEKSYMQN